MALKALFFLLLSVVIIFASAKPIASNETSSEEAIYSEEEVDGSENDWLVIAHNVDMSHDEREDQMMELLMKEIPEERREACLAMVRGALMNVHGVQHALQSNVGEERGLEVAREWFSHVGTKEYFDADQEKRKMIVKNGIRALWEKYGNNGRSAESSHFWNTAFQRELPESQE